MASALSSRRGFDETSRESVLLELTPMVASALRDGHACDREFALVAGTLLVSAPQPSNVLLQYAGKHLASLPGQDSLVIERALSPQSWTVIAQCAAPKDLDRFLSDWRDVVAKADEAGTRGRLLVGVMEAGLDRDSVRLLASDLVLHSQFEKSDASRVLEWVGSIATNRLRNDEGYRQAVLAWLERSLAEKRTLPEGPTFDDLVAQVVDHDAASALTQRLELQTLRSVAMYVPSLFRRLDSIAPEALAERIGRAWRLDRSSFDLRPFLAPGALKFCHELLPEISLLAAEIGYAKGLDPQSRFDPASLVPELRVLGHVEDELRLLAAQWMQILRRAKTPDISLKNVSVGAAAEAAVAAFAQDHASHFVAMLRSAPSLLANREIGWLEALALLGRNSAPVLAALEHYSTFELEPRLRDWARDVLAHWRTIRRADQAVSGELLSALSRHIDGRPTYPKPFAARSATWLASAEIEEAVRSAVRSAIDEFGLGRQPGQDEEVLTARLLLFLEQRLKGVNAVLTALGSAQLRPFNQPLLWTRQETKRREAGRGADAALIVTVDLPDVLTFCGASLVQVKKQAARRGGEALYDAWDIDVHQLFNELLPSSEASVYWLFGPGPETHVVPARLLAALIRGQRQDQQKSARVDYASIRSMSIPFEQYLVDLVLGGWIASTDPSTLAIARGESALNKPAVVFELTLRAGPETG